MPTKTVSEVAIGDKIQFCRRWWQVVAIESPRNSGRSREGELAFVLRSSNQTICQIFDQDAVVVCQESACDPLEKQKVADWLTQFTETVERWQYLQLKLNRQKTRKRNHEHS